MVSSIVKWNYWFGRLVDKLMCCHRFKGPVLYPVRKAGSILRIAKCKKLNAKCKMLNVKCQMGVRLANIPATVTFKLKRKAWDCENYYYRVIINAKCLMSNAKCEMQNLRCELLYHARSREKCTCPRVISHWINDSHFKFSFQHFALRI